MKEIMAIIRMNKIGATKKALVDMGIDSMTARKVLGRGKMKNLLTITENLDDATKTEVLGQIAEGLSEGSRLVPKRMLTIVVHDDQVKKTIDTIIKVNQEGNSGDGKIFVLPVSDAVTVRTETRGEEAI